MRTKLEAIALFPFVLTLLAGCAEGPDPDESAGADVDSESTTADAARAVTLMKLSTPQCTSSGSANGPLGPYSLPESAFDPESPLASKFQPGVGQSPLGVSEPQR